MSQLNGELGCYWHWLCHHYAVAQKGAVMWRQMTNEQNFLGELWYFLAGKIFCLFHQTCGIQNCFHHANWNDYLIVEES